MFLVKTNQEDCEVWWLRTSESASRRYRGNYGTRNKPERFRDFWETGPRPEFVRWLHCTIVSSDKALSVHWTNITNTCWAVLSTLWTTGASSTSLPKVPLKYAFPAYNKTDKTLHLLLCQLNLLQPFKKVLFFPQFWEFVKLWNHLEKELITRFRRLVIEFVSQ